MNKSMQMTAIGAFIGVVAAGLAFKYGATLPVVKDARIGFGG